MPDAYTEADVMANRLAHRLPLRRATLTTSKPIVTFSFDDVPETAFTNGARVLEQHGVRGTFYAAGGLAGTMHDGQMMLDEAGYSELHRRGHEIACHTFSHRTPRQLGWGFGRNLEQNAEFVERVSGMRPRNFAFPYGLSSLRAQWQLTRRYRSGRGIRRGLNQGRVDLNALAAVEIRPEYDEQALSKRLDKIAAAPAWLIYFTHDVSDNPSKFGSPTAWLDRLVEKALRLGCDVLTVDAALDRLGLETVPQGLAAE